jgi:hypothetical protein
MPDADPYADWSLLDRLQMLIFEAEGNTPRRQKIGLAHSGLLPGTLPAR